MSQGGGSYLVFAAELFYDCHRTQLTTHKAARRQAAQSDEAWGGTEAVHISPNSDGTMNPPAATVAYWNVHRKLMHLS